MRDMLLIWVEINTFSNEFPGNLVKIDINIGNNTKENFHVDVLI